MPRQILPHLEALSQQIHGVLSHYRRMLDDEFLFGSGAQMPQVATIFDRVADTPLRFSGEDLSLTDLLTLIAYRYGFEQIRIAGHGGYAIVLGHRTDSITSSEQRRVMRLVPEHHVRDIIADSDTIREFDVRLHNGDPVRDAEYPLLLSDLFLVPRHTTKLVFYNSDGSQLRAGGYPASLHCQLLPEVHPFNYQPHQRQAKLNRPMAEDAGNLLEAALATLGVSVADAHGGNGGVLVDRDGQPMVHQMRLSDGTLREQYIPVVLDYGYYSRIGSRTLAGILVRHGVTFEMVAQCMLLHGRRRVQRRDDTPLIESIAQVIHETDLPRNLFGQLLYHVIPHRLDPFIWIDRADRHWQSAKEKTYPALKTQSRLSRLYPQYDEALFPQRIEEYEFTL